MKRRTARRRALEIGALSLAGAAWVLAVQLAKSASAPQDATIVQLLSKDLEHVAGREVSMITVEYPPGWSDAVHTHHAQALVYVLKGSVVMQLRGGEPVTRTAGQTFYEGPDDVHVVGRNSSSTEPATLLVALVKNKGEPILTPVQ